MMLADVSRKQVLVQRLVDLQARLQHLDLRHRARMEEAYFLSQQLGLLLSATEGRPLMSTPLGGELQLPRSPKNASLTSENQPLRTPSVYSFLPHLLDDPLSLHPAFTLSRNRSGVSIVMGMPTVKREGHSYFLPTLHNLMKSMNNEDSADSLIIVFVAEVVWLLFLHSDFLLRIFVFRVEKDFVHQIAGQVEENFRDQVEAGLIEVISPPASYYPDMDKLQQTLGDPPERVRWRTKQNLDFAFLMMYAQPKGTFYVQLEDDILAKKNFISTMKNYALMKTAEKSPWFVLEFCQLGFIGKMFKCAQLPWLIHFILMFYNDKPVDWLLDHLIFTKSCRLDKDSKACKNEKAKLWVPYKTSLFQHTGLHSSLKGKVQKLQDKNFGTVPMYYPHSNPQANFSSTIATYKQFSLDRAYKGETFFWGLQPKTGDKVIFTFRSPQRLKHYLFQSGNVKHAEDCFYNTTIEVMPDSSQTNVSKTEYNVTRDGFFIVGKFNILGVAKGLIDPELNPVKVIRLNVHGDSENWVILSEVSLVHFSSRGKLDELGPRVVVVEVKAYHNIS
ncbi:hypothetical protein PR048_022208 [Dryococelus australis]|uniref:Alpha-1,3-mannosyl-glycoprotein 4-beta-N-acetylglucosaminyltransferase B n=1 Tax=Dryococelus australis TaxID=614101 RepID=A0ABQ9H0E0_9NEOP|nr:hypothetical protein PR048_022208 [Dryococelus australis]